MFEFQFMPGFWEFFRTYAPSIPMPSIYWDVRSPEQRVHMICKWLGVVIEYCNVTGQQVDEIKQTLDDIESGRLDPMIEDAIAQWFIDNQPEIMQDIADLDGEVITINENIDNLTETVADNVADIEHIKIGQRFTAYLAPDYVGDTLAYRQHGSCCRVGNDYYMLFAVPAGGTESSSYVEIAHYNPFEPVETGNVLTGRVNAQIGHANSVCWDSVRNRFWVAPLYKYIGTTETTTTEIYNFDRDWSNRTTVAFDRIIFAVSFDPVTRNLYALSRVDDQGVTGSAVIYRMMPNETTFTKLFTITPQDLYDQGISTIQDMAVYDNVIHICTPQGAMYQFLISADGTDFTRLETFQIGYVDSADKWTFGEHEGLEFDAEGRLYQARNKLVAAHATGEVGSYSLNNAFVTEIKTDKTFTPNLSHRQANITNLTVNTTRFKLGNANVRSIAQLESLSANVHPAAVTIESGTTLVEHIVTIKKQPCIAIVVHGNLTIDQFAIYNGGMFLMVDTDGTLNFTGVEASAILTQNRGATIQFRNRGTINIDSHISYFLASSYAPTLFICGGIGNLTSINVNGTEVTGPAMLYGSHVVASN